MKKFLVLIMFLFLIVPVAHAAVLAFEDVGFKTDGSSIDDGYGEFDWNRFSYLKVTTPAQAGSGYANANVSGEYVAFGNGAVIGGISLTGSIFTFNSAYFTSAWRDGLSIKVKGFSDNVESYSKIVTVDTSGPTKFDFNFIDIDRLAFASFGGTEVVGMAGTGYYFAMDNFTFNESVPPSTVPVPSTIFLLASGILGLAGVSRRRKQA